MNGIYGTGDVLPALIVTTVERVQPGEIYWGCTVDADGRSTRKGWIIEPEGLPVPQGAVPQDFETAGVPHRWWMIASRQFRRGDDLVLVQRKP